MKESSDFEIIPPSNMLAAKVPKDGPKPETLFARAEAAISDMRDDFVACSNEDVETLARAVADAKADGAACESHLETAFVIAHDMRGLGGTYGFSLVTEIGGSLCAFLEGLETPGARDYEVIDAHVDALTTAIHRRIDGDGGELGREMIAGLRKAVQKVGR